MKDSKHDVRCDLMQGLLYLVQALVPEVPDDEGKEGKQLERLMNGLRESINAIRSYQVAKRGRDGQA